ncbi:MAG: amidohydrolase [Clostridia bacterium]|nr:amidohydrolase [Clostridia bacterium]
MRHPWFEAGTLGIKSGPVMAAADRFAIHLTGKGAHAAHPELSVDVIPAMAALIQSVQTIVSRTVDPFDNAVVSITRAQAGNTWNIIPEAAELEGTVRALAPSVRDSIQAKLERVARHTAAAHGCEAAFTYHRGPDPVINDEAACHRVSALARAMGFEIKQQAGTMGAEDFSDYLAIAPGAFIRVGTGGGVDAHHPKFTADPKALYPAAKYFAALAEKELHRLKGES